MKITWKTVVFTLILLVALYFIINSLLNAAPQTVDVKPPDITTSPMRFYGSIEPAGGIVYISPPLTKSVTVIYVAEGDEVKKGDKIASLDDSVEKAQLNVAISQAETLRKTAELSNDSFRRNQKLHDDGTITDYEYTQSRLKKELDERNLNTALNQIQLARTQLARLTLTSPIDGKVYKLDIRLGETIAAGDNNLIQLGKNELWARMYLESYWINRLRKGMHYHILDSETQKTLGEGEIISIAPYMGSRSFRTEDPRDRNDNKYIEVVISITKMIENMPIGLVVMAELME